MAVEIKVKWTKIQENIFLNAFPAAFVEANQRQLHGPGEKLVNIRLSIKLYKPIAKIASVLTLG